MPILSFICRARIIQSCNVTEGVDVAQAVEVGDVMRSVTVSERATD